VSLSTPSSPSRAYRAILNIATRFLGRDVTQGLVATIVLQVVGAVVSFAMFLLAARALTSVDFGHLSMWLSVCQMAGIVAVLGQEMFILRSLNEYTVAARPDLAKGSLVFSLSIVCTVPTVFALAMSLCGVLVFNETPSLMMATGLYLIASSLIAVSSHIARFSVGIVLADGMRELLWRLLVVVVLLALVGAGGLIRINEFFLIASAAIGTALLIQAVAIWRALPKSIHRARPSWRIREWSRASAGFWASTILETINQYLDVVIVYWLLDPASAGAYFIASRLANMFATVLSAVHNYATRLIPALYFSGRFDELNHILKSMAEVVLLCIVAGIILIGFGADTILGAFGPAFVAQKWTLIILTMGTVIYAAGGPAAAVLMIAGHGGRYPWVVAANMILRFTGFAILIPHFGLQGAAVSAAISLAVVTLALNYLCRRWVKIDPSVLILIHARPNKKLPIGPSSPTAHAASRAQNSAVV
jgi:O-antigen/teichoic acid export membrane protein